MPRAMFGCITLCVTPADEFRFIDHVSWPAEPELFSLCVLDGILDALLIDLGESPGGATFTLEAIEWRPVSSVPRAYGIATREAVSELYGLDQRERLGFVDDNAA